VAWVGQKGHEYRPSGFMVESKEDRSLSEGTCSVENSCATLPK